ncbi:MAG: TonB-dependent receptor, partial [Novosphingobium sp.]|nr:TonB-dependent receptor [Novosphingobium sp.]
MTATKRAESLQDVPMAITAITGEEIERQGIEDFSDFARQTPGVIVTEAAKHFGKFVIRGLETNTTYSGFSNKLTAVYIDEIPLTNLSINTPDMRLYDIDRIEVLRGPQGTLFGSSSMGGAVRIITKKPNLGKLQGSLAADFALTEGDSWRQRYNVMLNAPFVEGVLGVRLVGYYRNEEGYITNIGFGKTNSDSSEEWGGRLSLRWSPTDKLNVTLSAMRDDSDISDLSLSDPVLGTHVRASFVPDITDLTTQTYSATVEYDFNFASLLSTTAYAESERVFDLGLPRVLTAVLPVGFRSYEALSSVMNETRLVSPPGGRFDWVVGTFLIDRERDGRAGLFTSAEFLRTRNISGLPRNLRPEEDTLDVSDASSVLTQAEAAIFGELSYHLTPTVTLTGGLRYGSSEVSQTNLATGFDATGAVVAAITGGGNRTINIVPRTATTSLSTGSTKKLVKKVSLSWERTEDQTYYALASQGFRIPNPNFGSLVNGGRSTTDPNDPIVIEGAVRSDSLWNYEVGAKTSWLSDRLVANIALYYIRWDDIQQPLARPSDSAPYFGTAGGAVSKGVEVEVQARPSEGLQLGLSLTLQDAKITSLTADEARATGAVKGARLASPNFQASISAVYSWNI